LFNLWSITEFRLNKHSESMTMTTYQIMYWHGIPVQVRAGGRRDRVSLQMPPRFLDAVDKIAMASGLTGSEAYTDGFVWDAAQEREGLAAEVATAIVAELGAQYFTIDWRDIAAKLREQHKR
jgi:hypothetical protein